LRVTVEFRTSAPSLDEAARAIDDDTWHVTKVSSNTMSIAGARPRGLEESAGVPFTNRPLYLSLRSLISALVSLHDRYPITRVAA
jgi:hypothetical protein